MSFTIAKILTTHHTTSQCLTNFLANHRNSGKTNLAHTEAFMWGYLLENSNNLKMCKVIGHTSSELSIHFEASFLGSTSSTVANLLSKSQSSYVNG